MPTAPAPTPAAPVPPIQGNTRVFMILGDPVAQVRAPELFNSLFAEHGINAVLVPAEVAPADLAGFTQHTLKARNIDGLWLTIPHKAAMVPLLDHCDDVGRSAGAVNAARRNADGSLEGALFDGLGFAKSLDHFGINCAGRRVLILGAGGAGLAIAATLAQRAPAELALFDPQAGRATEVVERLQPATSTPLVVATGSDPAGFDVVINASPLGLKPTDPLPCDVNRLAPDAAVVDILMKNQPTPLLQACHARGIVAHPGFEMLVQQVPEYLEFFGYPALAAAVQANPARVRALFQAE